MGSHRAAARDGGIGPDLGTRPWGRAGGCRGRVPRRCVLAAVHHAEVVAHRIGEPFGSLVLAVAVTVIEVALIVTLMVSGGPETASLARDTVFAAVMITTNGIVGISLLLGALRYGVTLFNAEGSGAALATVGRGQCPHRGPGAGHPAAGRRSPRPARCVPVPRHQPLTVRSHQAEGGARARRTHSVRLAELGGHSPRRW